MTMRRFLVWVVTAITLVGTGTYVIIDLYRWEWIRAMMTALFFIAMEVGLLAWLLSGRLSALERRLDERRERRESIAGHLATARGEPSRTFRWLARPPDGAHVFVPLFLAAGVILSALAWLVERVSRMVAGGTADAMLADQLARLGPPRDGFLDRRDDPLRLLRGPTR